jgi:hypothetical protein
MFPGGMEYGEEEVEAARVIGPQLFRYRRRRRPQRSGRFEREFAAHPGSKHALMNAGSSPLICALVGAGVRPGDEVIVPAYTWTPRRRGRRDRAVPVLVEVDESLTLDRGRRAVSRARPAILPVHMRGAPADMGALAAIAREHGLAPSRTSASPLGLHMAAAARDVRRRRRLQPSVQQDHHDGRGGVPIRIATTCSTLRSTSTIAPAARAAAPACRSMRATTSAPPRSRARSRACS